MTDRPKTWTDEELRSANALADKNVLPGIISCQPNLTWLRAFLSNLPAYSAAECREREREAWDACWYCLTATATDVLGRNHEVDRPMQRERDIRYPSLLPPPPPVLRLSTGEWARKTQELGSHRMLWSEPTANLLFTHPTVDTASDARALAAWLAQYGSDDERK